MLLWKFVSEHILHPLRVHIKIAFFICLYTWSTWMCQPVSINESFEFWIWL